MNNLNNQNLNDYLHFGYIPQFGNTEKISHILNIDNKKVQPLESIEEDALIVKGIKILNNVFDNLVADKKDRKHLVTLSGGLDSRIILSALLDRINPKNIHAVTFGSPKSFDYEIPKKVVKNTGVNYERINCIKLDYSLDKLVKSLENGGKWTTPPDMYVNRLALKLNEDYCRWSGFEGGIIAGNSSTKGANSKNEAKLFCEKQKRSKSIDLTQKEYDPVPSLVGINSKSILNLTPYEMATLNNRTPAELTPIQIPNNRELIAPLIHPDWVEFMLQLPKKFREDCYLFKKILTKMYPNAMGIACKNNFGLPLTNYNKFDYLKNRIRLKMNFEISKAMKDVNFPPIGVNYLHFPEAIRKLPTLRKSVEVACDNLDERKIIPWIKASEIFKDHMERKNDHSQALLVLLGLEVNLRAK